MRRTASENAFWYRILPWIIGLAAVFSASGLLFRMLWFDEVLTVNLLMKLPLHRIYFAYEIPNNHIVFTLLEKIWYSIVGMVTGFSYFYFRLVPLFCGAAAIVLLVRKMIRSCGLAAGVLVPGVFAVSSVFAMYATAVRGYMTGFLLTVLVMFCAEKLIRRAWFRDHLIYFILSVLSVGVAPSNLAALTGVVLYFLPLGFRRGRRGIRRLIFMAASPVIALVLFYLPILNKFIGCIRLGEGWPSASGGIYAFYTGSLFPVAGLLIFCAAGSLFIFRKFPKLRWNLLCGLALLLMPLAAYAVMKVPPFPRVFFPLLPVWLFLFAHSMNGFFHWVHSRQSVVFTVFALQAVFCAAFFSSRAMAAGDFFYGPDGRNDDYLIPYYARPSFEPNRLLEYLRKKYQEEGKFHVFAAFDADPPSLAFASSLMDFPEDVLLVDPLNRPKTLRLQDYPGPKYLICGNQPELNRTLARFGFRSAVEEKQFGIQHLYRVIE